MTPARAAQARNISIAAGNKKLCPDKSGLVIASEAIGGYKREEIHEKIIGS